MILSGDYVSGVYIFDQYNNCYSSYKRTPRKVNKYIQGADWYKKMQSAGGNGFFIREVMAQQNTMKIITICVM